ncbi:TrmB family transcriptional regulator sugar-binding domain-containing protein [Pyrococcus sp. NA2]|uniref:TrmB family transcriptional regulator sugar-binding domain-containing protein n=1 Tax=Pyrococcus sp. (strain NA2) TaxID=342949 RepID=UPI00064F946F|nr:TrmB family transcriptional regulator sugar-binding domain-containing protein [Pyrococcus sp. NA2]
MNKYKLVVIGIIFIAFGGIALTKVAKHYEGGEIYEAANEAMNLLGKGFNVTVRVVTVDGRTIEGEVFAAKGSQITIIVNGTKISVGGPSATREDVRAKHVDVIVRGKVYVYEIPGMEEGFEKFESYWTNDTYSMRFSGLIYIENISFIELGKLKYSADYLSFGSITINEIHEDNAVIWASHVPIQILESHLRGKKVFYYGTLYVNSERRTLPFRLIGVRNP